MPSIHRHASSQGWQPGPQHQGHAGGAHGRRTLLPGGWIGYRWDGTIGHGRIFGEYPSWLWKYIILYIYIIVIYIYIYIIVYIYIYIYMDHRSTINKLVTYIGFYIIVELKFDDIVFSGCLLSIVDFTWIPRRLTKSRFSSLSHVVPPKPTVSSFDFSNLV